MKRVYTIPKVSKKQAKRNRDLARIKTTLPVMCEVCNKRPAKDTMHLLPRSTFPEFYTAEWNLIGGCRCCHTEYDDNKEFRQKQKHLYEIVKANAGEQIAFRYFGI